MTKLQRGEYDLVPGYKFVDVLQITGNMKYWLPIGQLVMRKKTSGRFTRYLTNGMESPMESEARPLSVMKLLVPKYSMAC